MDYNEFKEKLLEALRDRYGDSAEVEIERVKKNNRIFYDGLRIRKNGEGSRLMPVIKLADLYEEYCRNGMEMEASVQTVIRMVENIGIPESVEQFIERVKDWDFIKDHVYPILLSTEENEELLQDLISTPMLDLSVAYIIRTQMEDGCDGSIKISKNLMESYRISVEQLHDQAMENLRRDGYEFQSLDSLIRSIVGEDEAEEMCRCIGHESVMHVLTNSGKTYGAAGILDKELLKEFAGEQDYYILPASIHETIFVPSTGADDREKLDAMVQEVNATKVCVEERLSDHSYFYDARANEIRLCA